MILIRRLRYIIIGFIFYIFLKSLILLFWDNNSKQFVNLSSRLGLEHRAPMVNVTHDVQVKRGPIRGKYFPSRDARAQTKYGVDRQPKTAIPDQTTAVIAAPNMTQVRKSFEMKTDAPNNNTKYMYKPDFESLNNFNKNLTVSIFDIQQLNEFSYEPFQRRIPNFISTYDRDIFYKDPLNKKQLKNPPKELLRGIVEIVENGTFMMPHDCGWKSNSKKWYEYKKPDVSLDMLCPLIIPDGWSFQHFLDGTLPKIIQILPMLKHPSMKLLLPTPRDKIIFEILSKLGIAKHQIIFGGRFPSRVYSSRFMLFTCVTPPLHPKLWQTASRLLGAPAKLPVPRDQGLIILLTREGSYNPGRKMLNKPEVLDVLRAKYGSDIVVEFTGGYSLQKSVELFGKARIMIGIHGGALYNQNFASSDATVVEIVPCDNKGMAHHAHTIFWAMSDMMNQTYWRMYQTGDQSENINVDVKKLTQILAKIDDAELNGEAK